MTILIFPPRTKGLPERSPDYEAWRENGPWVGPVGQPLWPQWLREIERDRRLPLEQSPPCRTCGGETHFTPGRGPHWRGCRCIQCGAHRWLPRPRPSSGDKS